MKYVKRFIVNSPSQTKKLGRILGREIINTTAKKRALILALRGELGVGKTTFLQGLAKGLGIRSKILSPTFVLVKKFKIQNPGFKYFYHIDCYRLKSQRELLALGFRSVIEDPQNVVALEWAGNVKKIVPRGSLWIRFKFLGKNQRRIVLNK